jgi:restriction endonuclease S subunit
MLSLILPKNKGLIFGDDKMAVFSIIKLSELQGAKRVDAEYYQPAYLERSKKLRSNKFYKKFSKIMIRGNYGILPKSEDYIEEDESEDHIYLIRGFDLRGINIIEENLVKVPKGYLKEKAIVKEGDLLFLVKGATIDAEDSVAIVPSLTKKAIFNGSIYRPIFKNEIIKEFAYVYMRTKYFYNQKRRLSSNVGIEYNSASEIKSYDFIVPSKKFQENIKSITKESFEKEYDSRLFYRRAETFLLEELGLKNFKPKYEKTYTANLSDTFRVRRVDAEYFQPAYETLVKKLKERVELKPLRKFILSVQKGVEAGSEQYGERGKPFIRVSNLTIHGFIDRDQKYISEELYQQLEPTYEPKEGDFLLTKDATPGIAYIVKEPIEGIISSGILKLIINGNEINKEYLALCISSLIGKMQVERDGGGSVIIHWKPEQIKRLQIPILSLETQQKIASLVQQSHEARKKAKELLEVAKKAVEIAIEKNEEEALDYISKNEI